MNRTGTVKELTSNFLFNGQRLNGVEFGILAKTLGARFATVKGTAERPAGQRGKPATIWQLASKNLPLKVTEAVNVADPAPAAADEASASSEESATDADNTVL